MKMLKKHGHVVEQRRLLFISTLFVFFWLIVVILKNEKATRVVFKKAAIFACFFCKNLKFEFSKMRGADNQTVSCCATLRHFRS
jgi:hypothetical protein